MKETGTMSESDGELNFLRKLEQDLQRLHNRVRNGYSGVPEVLTLKREVNDRIIVILAARVATEGDDE